MSGEWNTIPQMMWAQGKRYGTRAVLKVKREFRYRDIGWNELAHQFQAVGLGLLEFGIQPGDRVALLSENRPEWAFTDLGILSVGAVTVPIYTTLTPPEIEYILKDSGAHLIFVSTPELMTKVLPFQETLNLKMVLFDAPYRVSGPRIWWLGEWIGLGKTAGPSARETWNKRLKEGKKEDLASIIYTSGTTGPPKGVMLSHGNFLSNAQATQQVLPVSDQDVTLSFLPLSHVFERMAGYYFVLLVGGTIAYAENMETVPLNLLEVRPTVVTGVPRFYEKFYERVQEAIRHSRGPKRWLARWAMSVGQRWAKRVGSESPVSFSLRWQHWLADWLVLPQLRARLGGRLRFFVSGGAPLSKELAEFFYGMGILILEGYGLTETSPVITVNRPDRFRFGTVGLPLPEVEIQVSPDEEILTRGPHVMQGYFHKPKETTEAIDPEGWFHTGDMGSLSPEGFLTITDRKKDILKTSGGKMVAPQNLEAQLKADPLIADCVVIGDRRKYLTALIVPNLPPLEAFARQRGLSFDSAENLVRLPEVFSLIWEQVEHLNERLASFEQLKKITLLSQPFTMAGGELTPTLKVKRRVVAERYAYEIEAMYQEES